MILNIFEIIILFIMPVFLLYYKYIPFKYRQHTFISVTAISFLIIGFEKWSFKKLGISGKNILSNYYYYILFSIILSSLLIIVFKIDKRKINIKTESKYHFYYGFLLSSFIQEFLYRGFLIGKLKETIGPKKIIILINALLFSFLHVIFSNNLISLIGIFFGGVGFATIFLYYPNLLLVSISHSILNFLAVLFGFFSDENK